MFVSEATLLLRKCGDFNIVDTATGKINSTLIFRRIMVMAITLNLQRNKDASGRLY